MSIVKTYIGFGVRLITIGKTILVDSIAKFKCHHGEMNVKIFSFIIMIFVNSFV